MPLNTEFFETLTTYFERDGIPQERSDVAELVQSITGQDVLRHLMGDTCTFESIDNVANAYIEHRASHRIAAFREQQVAASNNSFLYLGRSTNTLPARMWSGIWDTVARIESMYVHPELAKLKNMPFVISEEARFDRNPMDNDVPEQHATLHTLNFEGLAECTINSLEHKVLDGITGGAGPMDFIRVATPVFFDADAYETAIAGIVTDMVNEGWELITRTFKYSVGDVTYEDRELVIGAVAPENIGRHAVLLMNMKPYNWASVLVIEMMIELYSRLPEVVIEEPTDDSLSVITVVEQARAAVAGIRQAITSTRENVTSRKAELDRLLTTVSTTTRVLADEERALYQMELGVERLALETVRDLSLLPELASTMRQVKSSELTTNNDQMLLEIQTHPFGMRVPAGNYRDDDNYLVTETNDTTLYIPSITIKLNFAKTNWSEAISFSSGDNYRWHPHVSGTSHPCWGQAATPLAESWARRDWESFIRILLGWFTQYDPRDIFTRVHSIIDRRGNAPRTGWLLPGEDGQEVGPLLEENENTVRGDYVEDEDVDDLNLVETR